MSFTISKNDKKSAVDNFINSRSYIQKVNNKIFCNICKISFTIGYHSKKVLIKYEETLNHINLKDGLTINVDEINRLLVTSFIDSGIFLNVLNTSKMINSLSQHLIIY